MSQENVEIVLGMLRDWTTGNREAARAVMADDVVFRVPPIDIGVGSGRSALERGLEGWRQAWEDFSLVHDEVIDGGDRVVVISRQRGRGKESGAEVDLNTNGVYTVRGSKVVGIDFFETRTAALEAVGLSE